MFAPNDIVCLICRHDDIDAFEAVLLAKMLEDSRKPMQQTIAASPKWQATRQEITTELAKGGELWEWESKGFEHFAGISGLVAIRDGNLLKRWTLFKS